MIGVGRGRHVLILGLIARRAGWYSKMGQHAFSCRSRIHVTQIHDISERQYVTLRHLRDEGDLKGAQYILRTM